MCETVDHIHIAAIFLSEGEATNVLPQVAMRKIFKKSDKFNS